MAGSPPWVRWIDTAPGSCLALTTRNLRGGAEQLDLGPTRSCNVCPLADARAALPAPHLRLCRGTLAVALLALTGAAPFAAADETGPRILTISESDSRLPLPRRMIAGMEAALGSEVTSGGDLYIEYLDLLRFNDAASLDHMRAFLATRFGRGDLDAVAVLGPNALAFLLENRDAIAPGVPVVFGAMSTEGLQRALGDRRPADDLSGVLSPFDIKATLALAHAAQPDATGIIVVAGSAPFDRQWRATAERLLGRSYLGLPVRHLPEQTAAEFLAGAAENDPQAIVLLLSVNLDAAGDRFLPIDFARRYAAASSAPVWTIYETQIGAGVVGGHMEDLAATGAEMGRMLLAAVAGVPLPPPVTVSTRPVVDWHVLQRFGIDPGNLPDGTEVKFHEPAAWERYRTEILLIAAVMIAQGITIAGLLFQRSRYLRAQATLTSERAQLIHISRNLRLGQLSAALAHEINQPLAAIRANADAGARLVTRTPTDTVEIGAILSDITDDVDRTSRIIANLRRLAVKGETSFDEIDLNEIVTATLALAGNELAARGAQVRPALSPDRLQVRGNASQLQQIVLNLALNAAEAMADLPEEARIVRVSTYRLPGGGAALAVADAGPGVPPDRRDEVFRPFVTSKTTGLGVGLSICRNIAEAHGGTLAFTDPEGPGARIEFALPPREAGR